MFLYIDLIIGCNINATDLDDRTPLNWAVRKSDVEAVKILCEAGCFVNSEERGEITALELAVSNGREDIVSMFYKMNKDFFKITDYVF